MKKSVLFRIALVMLVLTMVTSCFVGGTFAKYVTSAEGSDTARVAKFGVQLHVHSGSFADQYATDDAKYAADIVWSVDSDNGDKVVAPGTADAEGVHFSISGTPEVAVKVSALIGENFKDVYLAAGEYTDFTEVVGYSEDDIPLYATFELKEDYYPVVYTLTQTADAEGSEDRVIATGNLEAIQKALVAYTATAAYEPNTTLDSEFNLTWAWAFAQNNEADTWLGNAAAGLFYDANPDYSTTIAYDLSVVVEQID